MAEEDARAGSGPVGKRTAKTTGPIVGRAAPPAKKAPAKKAPAKKAPAKKAPAKKAPAKKAPAKKAPAKKAPAKRAPVKRAPVKRAPVKKAGRLDAGAALAPEPDGAASGPPRFAGSRLAGERTFDDDLPPPAPPAEDPAARARTALRSAAAALRAGEGGGGPSRYQPVEPLASTPDAGPVVEPPVTPARRLAPRRARRPEPEREPEWTADAQPLDEDTPPDRIPDAMDTLVLPGEPAPPAAPEPEPTTVRTQPPPSSPPPTPPTKTRKAGRAGLVRVVAIVAVVVLAVAIVVLVATRDKGVDYSKLKVGDCFDSSATNEVRGINVKSCSKSHNSEVFFLVTHPAAPADPYPGKDALVQFAADACLGQPLTDYLGMPLEQSRFKDFEIVPQESAWKDGRRLLVCGIDTGGQGKVTGSAKATKPPG